MRIPFTYKRSRSIKLTSYIEFRLEEKELRTPIQVVPLPKIYAEEHTYICLIIYQWLSVNENKVPNDVVHTDLYA